MKNIKKASYRKKNIYSLGLRAVCFSSDAAGFVHRQHIDGDFD